jgi:hypothetical protein
MHVADNIAQQQKQRVAIGTARTRRSGTRAERTGSNGARVIGSSSGPTSVGVRGASCSVLCASGVTVPGVVIVSGSSVRQAVELRGLWISVTCR